MALARALLRGAGALEERQATSTLSEPADWLWEGLGGVSSYTGKAVSVEAALGLIPVFACVRLLASTVGSLPLKVYERSADGKARKEAPNTNEWRLLHDEPNGEQAADQALENIVGHLNLWGNSYFEKVKSRSGVVGELWPILPTRCVPERQGGRKRFVIDGSPASFGEDTILHIPGFGYDGLKGLPPITQARQELGVELAIQEFVGRFIANQATPAGVIQLPEGQELEDQTKRDALRAEWQALYGSLQNAGKAAVLENGATWQSLGLPLKDIEFMALAKYGVNQTARLFQVPPEMIGGDRDSSMTYRTVEGWAINFVTYSLRRWFVRIEKALYRDRDLFPNRRRYPEFLAEALLRGDSQARANFYKTMAEIEALTINEIRQRENLDPLADGDRPPQVAGKAPQEEPGGNGSGDPALVPAPAKA